MKLVRLVSAERFKGEKHYLRNQRNYELAKTVILFVIAIGLFIAGLIINKGNKANIFTIVAVLGCLPACKCLVELIMFIRYKTCNDELADKIEDCSEGLIQAYDRVFTSKEKTYAVDHLVINNNSLCCYTSAKKFSESDFQKHITTYLKAENIKDTTVKVFLDDKKYLERISDMSADNNTEKDNNILNILLNISL